MPQDKHLPLPADDGQGGGNGTLNIDAGGAMNGGSGSIYLGDGVGSVGSFINNGSVTLTGELQVGRNGGTGTYTQSGGGMNLNGHHIQIAEGGGSNGTLNITAGSLSNSSWIHVGSGGGATGNLNVNFTNPADVLTTGDLYVGNNGATGNVTVSNGSLRSTGVTEVGRGGGAGTLTITGANSSVEAFTGGAADQFSGSA